MNNARVAELLVDMAETLRGRAIGCEDGVWSFSVCAYAGAHVTTCAHGVIAEALRAEYDILPMSSDSEMKMIKNDHGRLMRACTALLPWAMDNLVYGLGAWRTREELINITREKVG